MCVCPEQGVLNASQLRRPHPTVVRPKAAASAVAAPCFVLLFVADSRTLIWRVCCCLRGLDCAGLLLHIHLDQPEDLLLLVGTPGLGGRECGLPQVCLEHPLYATPCVLGGCAWTGSGATHLCTAAGNQPGQASVCLLQHMHPPLSHAWQQLPDNGAPALLHTHALCRRLLTHRSFKTFKVVEYMFTILATLTDQGPPMVWVSNHRYHHMHADTPLDPHTPYEGMWQAYMGWLFQQDKWRAVLDRTNVDDMKADPFHRFISATFPVWMIGRFALTYVSWCAAGCGCAWGLQRAWAWLGPRRAAQAWQCVCAELWVG